MTKASGQQPAANNPPPATRRTVREVIKPAIQASFEHDRTFTRCKPVFPAGISW